MVTEISVKKVKLADDYYLEFYVVDAYEIRAELSLGRDPTLVDTHYVPIDSVRLSRDGEVDENSGEVSKLESIPDFANRAFDEAKIWAQETIAEHRDANLLAAALEDILPSVI